jgi:hypothetical protein
LGHEQYVHHSCLTSGVGGALRRLTVEPEVGHVDSKTDETDEEKRHGEDDKDRYLPAVPPASKFAPSSAHSHCRALPVPKTYCLVDYSSLRDRA